MDEATRSRNSKLLIMLMAAYVLSDEKWIKLAEILDKIERAGAYASLNHDS